MNATTARFAPSQRTLLRPGSTRPLPVWRVAVMASLAAAAATQALELIARAAGVPMRAGSPGATTAATIGVGGFGVATLMSCAAGVVLAVVLARLSKRPARTYAVTSIVLTAVSLLSPAFAYGAVASTKVILASAHVLAAAIVIPVVARRLAVVSRR